MALSIIVHCLSCTFMVKDSVSVWYLNQGSNRLQVNDVSTFVLQKIIICFFSYSTCCLCLSRNILKCIPFLSVCKHGNHVNSRLPLIQKKKLLPWDSVHKQYSSSKKPPFGSTYWAHIWMPWVAGLLDTCTCRRVPLETADTGGCTWHSLHTYWPL